MELYLVRHGPAEERDPLRWPDDALRPLSAPGVKETRRAMRGFRRIAKPTGPITSSPFARARATAEILGRAVGKERSVEVWRELRSGAPAPGVAARIGRGRAPADGRVLVGHEPMLSELLGLLVVGEATPIGRFSKAGAAKISFDRAVSPGTGRLEWLLSRRQLVELSG